MTADSRDTSTRCWHDLLPGQCAACKEVKSSPAIRNGESGQQQVTMRVRRLVQALRAQERARGKKPAERKKFAAEVAAAEAQLTRAERRQANQIVGQAQEAAAARRRVRLDEDRLAGIARVPVVPQNVGRGRRS